MLVISDIQNHHILFEILLVACIKRLDSHRNIHIRFYARLVVLEISAGYYCILPIW